MESPGLSGSQGGAGALMMGGGGGAVKAREWECVLEVRGEAVLRMGSAGIGSEGAQGAFTSLECGEGWGRDGIGCKVESGEPAEESRRVCVCVQLEDGASWRPVHWVCRPRDRPHHPSPHSCLSIWGAVGSAIESFKGLVED